MAAKKGVMKVTLIQVPLKGKTKTDEVEVPMTGTTVWQMAETLGLSLKNRNVSVNGIPGTIHTIVNPDSSVEVRVTERPQGS